MTHAEAIDADRCGKVVEAANLYEGLLENATEDLLLNLAVLYWQTTDYGFWTALQLPKEFVARAGVRFPEVLSEAQRRNPASPAVQFWQKYIAWIDVGTDFDPNDCRKILQEHPEYREPALYLFSISQGKDYANEARALLAQARESGTTRARYVASVLESASR
jgi:hypothetical protein